jgi:hypothetical protein
VEKFARFGEQLVCVMRGREDPKIDPSSQVMVTFIAMSGSEGCLREKMNLYVGIEKCVNHLHMCICRLVFYMDPELRKKPGVKILILHSSSFIWHQDNRNEYNFNQNMLKWSVKFG